MLSLFSPLFFFEEDVPEEAIAAVNSYETQALVMVGLPHSDAGLATALDATFDARRDVFLIVSEHEKDRAQVAIKELGERIAASVGGISLLRAAVRGAYAHDPLANIQIVVAPREYSGVVAQMLLDLVAYRRRPVEGIPVFDERGVQLLVSKGNLEGARIEQTSFDGPVTWTEVLECVERLRHGPTIHAFDASIGLDALSLPHRTTALAFDSKRPTPDLVPWARYLDAWLIPLAMMTTDLLERLGVVAILHDSDLPPSGLERALAFKAMVQQRYAAAVEDVVRNSSHALSRTLMMEMRPDDYLIVAVDGMPELSWTYLAANYAATIAAPMLLLPAGSLELAESPSTLATESSNWNRDMGSSLGNAVKQLVGGRAIGELIDALRPRYVAFVCSRPDVPIEMVGLEPLGLRVAVGRLAGPTLASTAALITAAALSEERVVPPRVQAMIVDASNVVTQRVLPAAHDEASELVVCLSDELGVDAELLAGLTTESFQARAAHSHIVHFAGHASAGEGLQFIDGPLRPIEIASCRFAAQIVFANACETGVIAGAPAGWTGLAAAFITSGATSFIGSLRPIFDSHSKTLALQFYTEALAGESVGTSLQKARAHLQATAGGDTWSAFVLFGCPRVRLRAPKNG